MRYIGPLIEQMHNDLFNVLTTKIISGEKREVDFYPPPACKKVNFKYPDNESNRLTDVTFSNQGKELLWNNWGKWIWQNYPVGYHNGVGSSI